MIGLDSTYANKASAPTPRLAISITPVTFGFKSLIEGAVTTGVSIAGVSIAGVSIAGVSIAGVSIAGSILSSTATSVGEGSNFDKSAGGPKRVGL